MPPQAPQTLRFFGLSFPVYRLADARLAFSYTDTATGRRVVVKRSTLAKLREACEAVAYSITNAESAARDLTAEDRRIYIAAREALAPRPVDAVARDAAAAFRLLGDRASLTDAARYFATRNPGGLSAPPTSAAVDELLATLADRGRSEVYRTKLRADLVRFAAVFPDLAAVTEDDVAGYLRGIVAAGASLRRRDNIRDGLVRLFRFARGKDWLPRERETAAERVERIAEGVDHVSTFTPSEMSAILAAASPRWLPYFAIAGFAGLRNSEILRLDWSAVKWEHELIAVPRSIARKIRISRHVPLLDNLAAWLRPYAGRTGPILPHKTERAALAALGRELRSLETRAGIVWKQNALRHSFGSYRLAIVKAVAQVAIEMGNSPAQIREHYHDPKSDREALAWFSIAPTAAPNVLPITATP